MLWRSSCPFCWIFPAPRLRAYPRETVVAEKLEAMVTIGLDNSRMKDFYDLWALSRRFEFERSVLARAIGATFRRRNTGLPGRGRRTQGRDERALAVPASCAG